MKRKHCAAWNVMRGATMVAGIWIVSCSASKPLADASGTFSADSGSRDSGAKDMRHDTNDTAHDVHSAMDASLSRCPEAIADYCKSDGSSACITPWGISSSWVDEQANLSALCAAQATRVIVEQCGTIAIVSAVDSDDGTRFYYDTTSSKLVRVASYGFPMIGEECIAGVPVDPLNCSLDAMPSSILCFDAGLK